MSDKAIAKLKERQEKQLSLLGGQKQHQLQRLSQIATRQQNLDQQLQQLRNEFSVSGALALQNRGDIHAQLIPRKHKLEMEKQLAEAESSRVNQLWQQTLSKRQGLHWLQKNREEMRREEHRRQEQKQTDESASRSASSRNRY